MADGVSPKGGMSEKILATMSARCVLHTPFRQSPVHPYALLVVGRSARWGQDAYFRFTVPAMAAKLRVH
jgi:hypothetical protein